MNNDKIISELEEDYRSWLDSPSYNENLHDAIFIFVRKALQEAQKQKDDKSSSAPKDENSQLNQGGVNKHGNC